MKTMQLSENFVNYCSNMATSRQPVMYSIANAARPSLFELAKKNQMVSSILILTTLCF